MKRICLLVMTILMFTLPAMADTVSVRLGWGQDITVDFFGWGLFHSITEITPANCHDNPESDIVVYSGTPSSEYTTEHDIVSPDGLTVTHYFCLDARDEAENQSDCACISTDIDLNDAPIANAGGPYAGLVGEAIQFDGSSSSDVDGTIVSYNWNYGDSNTGTGITSTHAYTTAGTYTVTLAVVDNGEKFNVSTATVTITTDTTPPPEPQSLTIEVIITPPE